MSDTTMSNPAEGTHMPTNEANQLLRQLLQIIKELSDRENETSVKMSMLETSS
jgi:hypothetical protein